MDEEIIEFDATTDAVATLKDVLRSQGDQQIGVEFIRSSINTFDFGVMRVTPRAIAVQRMTRRHGDRYHLWGFALCIVDPDVDFMVTLQLVCARPTANGTGALLIETAERIARDKGYRFMRLLCLPKDRLRAFYRRLGYVEKELGVAGSNIKLFEMRKRL